MTRPAHVRPDLERDQAGTSDDAGTPRLAVILFALLGSGIAWSLHLLVSYAAVAWACTTGAGEAVARGVLLGTSALALAVTAWSMVVAWRRWHVARDVDRPEDDAWDARMGERTARVSFLMVAGLFLGVLFALGIVYDAMTVLWVPVCEPGVQA